jgi:hypothetical protein
MPSALPGSAEARRPCARALEPLVCRCGWKKFTDHKKERSF